MRTCYIYPYIILLSILFFSCGSPLPPEIQEEYAALPSTLNFNADVKPILSDKCFACHGPDKNKIKAGLVLHDEAVVFDELPESPGEYAIVPHNLSKSEVFHRILSEEESYLMPPPESHLSLTPKEKAILIKWIKDGAKYEPHWAFIKPEKASLPPTQLEDWPQNEIDHFILAAQEERNLAPSREADRQLLLRRLSLDLTGLPPTKEEVQAFVEDPSEDAYEQQVDRLLNAPHYGEKMAAHWMDIARFADTHGYTVDRYRDMSPWRDWVIAAFNRNMPYDTFLTWQLAGDLFPHPTKTQLLATGFLRLHQQNMEGGIIDEEFRVEYVADRTATLGTGLMAMTMGCARCHDHKYDPISQKEFYELFSFFNQVNEAGQISFNPADIPSPTLLLPTKKQEQSLAHLQQNIHATSSQLDSLSLAQTTKAKEWIEKQDYTRLIPRKLSEGLRGKYLLDNTLADIGSSHVGKMDRTFSKHEKPVFTDGKVGKGLLLDGDAWLRLHPQGVFSRSEPFSIGLWVHIPDSLTEGVIFHACEGAKLYAFKGYHLYLRENKLELMLAHTAPDNAITERSLVDMPKNEWVHLMMTYDGSSLAEGVKLYMNGKEVETALWVDNLYKDILFDRPMEKQPGLKIGARWRGQGLTGAKVDEILIYDRALTALEVRYIGDEAGANDLTSASFTQWAEKEKKMLEAYYIERISTPYAATYRELQQVRKAYADSMEGVKEVMIIKEMDRKRKTFILDRGLYDSPAEEVFPNTPESILPYPKDLPQNRLGLAQWLTHPDHPLTARVAVNRYWQQYFGRGIVRTSEDFGNQGELPSHPALLDWLASFFMESGWDVKALQKKIVMSAAYRQSSIADESQTDRDPDNVWLTRGPSERLTSEMLRDNALFASGLLNKEIGGESVKPYQPEGLWQMNSGKYEADRGDQLYRRSLYTFWKRTVPHPTLATFDQPDRSECAVRRQKTNTPLQALVLLNDPTYVEAAKKLGEQIAEAEEKVDGIQSAFMRLTGRKAWEEELELLLQLQQSEYEKIAEDPAHGKGWLETGEYNIGAGVDPQWVAANAIVASVIMNSDAAIMKR